ncbi:sperm-associated antigen 6 isoform X2 [Bicyclus anynana]|uniref:Sperm-associated antigen 6 isoform X2 n=1 Tax=Bicyclus anynana TaxID=110368 RepID=A0ABM3LRX8_BICAN|nr:sperm-associated antigen 6 isoform X2 [Bicyclus anynana]
MVFVQTMAELATRATNVKCLESAGVLDFLRPLLVDPCSTVRQCAVLAVARLAEHDEGVARQQLNGGMLTVALENLNKFNVKENAAWALGYIAKHSQYLAGLVVDAGALPLLVLAFQEPEISLKQIAAGALIDLAQFNPEAVVDAGAICHLVRGLENQDPKLKRSTLCALGAVASARPELAEAVVAGGALPPALLHAGHDNAPVRRAAACLLRDIVKHSVDAVVTLVDILHNEDSEDAELCAAAWTLGHIAKHSPQHSLAVAVANALPRLLQVYTNPKSSAEVKARASCALKQSLQCCLHRPALETLLHAAPTCILKYVLAQYSKILPNDARARRLFVTTGALRRVQEIDTVPGTSLKEYINIINSCFPEEIVRYYSPGYSDTLLDRVEAYTPQIPELFTDRVPSDCQSELTIENGK